MQEPAIAKNKLKMHFKVYASILIWDLKGTYKMWRYVQFYTKLCVPIAF